VLCAIAAVQEVMAVLADLFPDYKTLSQMANLSGADRKMVQRQLAGLPARIKEAQEKEMGDMMGKLKQVSSSSDVDVRCGADKTAWEWHPEAFRAVDGELPDGEG
jgi:hypothetical protein